MKDNDLILNIIAEKALQTKVSFPWFGSHDFFIEAMSRTDRKKLYADLINGKSITIPAGRTKGYIQDLLELLKKDVISHQEIGNKFKLMNDALEKKDTVITKDNIEGFLLQQLKLLADKKDEGREILLSYNNGEYNISDYVKSKIEGN